MTVASIFFFGNHHSMETPLTVSWLGVAGAISVIFGSLWILKYFSNSKPKPKPESPKKPRYVPPVIDCSRESLLADMEKTRNRPIEKLPISVDLPRLARKTIIKEGDILVLDGTAIDYEYQEENEQEIRAMLIYQVWSKLATLLNEERPQAYENLEKQLATAGDISFSLGVFLKEHYTDDSIVIRLLKVFV